MAEETKKLYRSKDDRLLAGVCGGIGEYFNLDPTLVRGLFVLFALVVGGGLLLYIILWIIMPEEPGDVMDMAPEAEEMVEEEVSAEPAEGDE